MGQLAVRLPDHLHARMKEVPINWSEVVREAIEARLAKVERERLLAAWAATSGADSEPGTAVAALREDRDG